MPRLPSVILFPDPKLRRRAETVPDAVFGTSGLREYCQLLANLLVAVEQADVLAGTQIDFDPSWCVLALQTGNDARSISSHKTSVSVLLNPVIRDESGEAVEFEKSASFACVPCLLSAPTKMTVEYRKVDGTRRKVECSRSGARAIFQGCESLKGKPVIDRMTAVAAHQLVQRFKEYLEERLAPALFLPDMSVVVPN
jgi:peptide deformylase